MRRINRDPVEVDDVTEPLAPEKMKKNIPLHNLAESGIETSKAKSVEPQPYNDNPNLPLYKLEQVPYHLSDNSYILTGYRMKYTTLMCFRSIFALHNETFNIWTHLLGYLAFIGAFAALFIGVLIPSYIQRHRSDNVDSLTDVPDSNWLIFLIFGTYSLGCLMCTSCSAIFHTLLPHENMSVYAWAHALDYFGITVLVVGSFIPFCYFCFSCEPFWRWTYLIMITAFGVVGLLGPFFRQWTHQKYQMPKILFYVCMVGSGLFPIIHIYALLPGKVMSPYVGGLMLMMSLYGIGVFMYVVKIPEIFFPGKFDIYLSSHQIWHVFVLAAAFVHFFNCTSMYINFSRMGTSC